MKSEHVASSRMQANVALYSVVVKTKSFGRSRGGVPVSRMQEDKQVVTKRVVGHLGRHGLCVGS